MMLRQGAVGIAILAVLILIIVLIVKGCSGGTDVLKGKWDLDGTTAYEFSGDGNGALLLPNATYEFSYDIKKDQISIDYENESVHFHKPRMEEGFPNNDFCRYPNLLIHEGIHPYVLHQLFLDANQLFHCLQLIDLSSLL